MPSSSPSRPNTTNAMCGIDLSRAPSGRCHFSARLSQGIALARSALGWVLAAFQAAVGALRACRSAGHDRSRIFEAPQFFARSCDLHDANTLSLPRPNGPPEPSPGLSEAMPWVTRHPIEQRPERARETSPIPQPIAEIPGIDASRAPSGRSRPSAPASQGIAPARSALGWVLAAFQAALGARRSRRRSVRTPTVIRTRLCARSFLRPEGRAPSLR